MQFRSLLVSSLLGLGLAASATLPAFAHATIVDTTPNASKSVGEVTTIAVTANEDLLDIGKHAKGFVLAVRDSAGHYFGDGCVTVDGTTASTGVALTAAGKYIVLYRVVSNDGHPIEGKFSFTFIGDSSATTPAPAYASIPACGVEQSAIATDENSNSESSESTNDEAITSPTSEPSLAPSAPASPNDMGILPYLGLATIPVLAGAIWLLVRTLGKRDSEDHLN